MTQKTLIILTGENNKSLAELLSNGKSNVEIITDDMPNDGQYTLSEESLDEKEKIMRSERYLVKAFADPTIDLIIDSRPNKNEEQIALCLRLGKLYGCEISVLRDVYQPDIKPSAYVFASLKKKSKFSNIGNFLSGLKKK